MGVRTVAALGALVVATSACSEPLEFAEWTIPVAEGTEVVEYAHVPSDEREGERIEWVDELVIGDEVDADAGYVFGRPRDVAVDARGRIYVVDPQSVSVYVFDADGEFLRRLGREGQGPGEFQYPDSVVALDDRVIVTASRNGRLSHFDLDGDHVADHPFPVFDNLGLMVALPGGEVIGSTLRFTDAEQVEREFAAYSPEGEKLRTYATFAYAQVPTIQRGTRRTFFNRMPNAYPMAVASNDGLVYWSRQDEYQVLAVGPDTKPRWALRVAFTPSALPDEQVDEIMGLVRDHYEDATESEVNFPDRHPALSGLRVDGHGHLWVYPYVYSPLDSETDSETDEVPVDVYAPDGERLFAGMTARHSWVHAEGDFIWEIGTDPATSEHVVRKTRIVEPFE